ncbi:MAG: hypothetical protein Q9165_006990 [Trypethelium subeluteriae]
MPLKDLLKKKDKLSGDSSQSASTASAQPDVPQFTFLRTTTDLQETIEPPTFPGDHPTSSSPHPKSSSSRLTSRFRKHSNPPPPTAPTSAANAHAHANVRPDVQPNDTKPRDPNDFTPPMTKAHHHERKLSERLHLHSRSHSSSSSVSSSVNLPADLPEVAPGEVAVDVRDEEGQARWEERATVLAKSTAGLDGGRGRVAERESAGIEGGGGRGTAGMAGGQGRGGEGGLGTHAVSGDVQAGGRSRSRSRSVGDEVGDANIQRAIELHEQGDLERSTKIFGILADPEGANNALSQVLYGLALSAEVESLALSAGMKKGGVAKGELVLAIFELANCFRNGWGIAKDPAAARKYYETAANLGDTDAMNEIAWCYLEGFGGKKDKVRLCQFS